MKLFFLSVLTVLIILLITKISYLAEASQSRESDLNEFIDRAFRIYSFKRTEPDIDYNEKINIGLRRRLKYNEFICIEFINKKYSEKYFNNLINKVKTDTNFIKLYQIGGINICLLSNYVIEQRKSKYKICDSINDSKLEDALYSPYLKKNKRTFIRLKCNSKTVEVK